MTVQARQDRRATTGSSATWTESSDDFADVSDADDGRVRSEFVAEYNRVAKKVGVVSPIVGSK